MAEKAETCRRLIRRVYIIVRNYSAVVETVHVDLSHCTKHG